MGKFIISTIIGLVLGFFGFFLPVGGEVNFVILMGGLVGGMSIGTRWLRSKKAKKIIKFIGLLALATSVILLLVIVIWNNWDTISGILGIIFVIWIGWCVISNGSKRGGNNSRSSSGSSSGGGSYERSNSGPSWQDDQKAEEYLKSQVLSGVRGMIEWLERETERKFYVHNVNISIDNSFEVKYSFNCESRQNESDVNYFIEHEMEKLVEEKINRYS